MNASNPILTEPGVKYFLNETLKQCHKKRTVINNYYFNLSMLFIFSVTLSILLIYKYNTRPRRRGKIKI